MKRSRRILLQGLAAAAPVGMLAEQAAAQQKLAQNLIQYQTTPKNGQRCDACTHWQPPSACAIVESPILPQGWCGVFAPKA